MLARAVRAGPFAGRARVVRARATLEPGCVVVDGVRVHRHRHERSGRAMRLGEAGAIDALRPCTNIAQITAS